jgi:hypothetical protein
VMNAHSQKATENYTRDKRVSDQILGDARRIAATFAKLPVTTLTLFRARINSRQNHDLP